MTDHPTTDDPSIVERIWSVLDAYGMGVMRKDDLDALTARIRELEAENARLCCIHGDTCNVDGIC